MYALQTEFCLIFFRLIFMVNPLNLRFYCTDSISRTQNDNTFVIQWEKLNFSIAIFPQYSTHLSGVGQRKKFKYFFFHSQRTNTLLSDIVKLFSIKTFHHSKLLSLSLYLQFNRKEIQYFFEIFSHTKNYLFSILAQNYVE